MHLSIIDNLDKSSDDLCKDDDNVDFIFGKDYLNDLEKYDLIIKSPGISLNYLNEDYLNKIIPKITSQLELLLEVNSKNIIGITGTKGKSTTSSLLYNVLKDQDKEVILAGNIGIPVFDEINNYHSDTTLVIEMSSHQLEYIKVSPHIGVILNLYQDHLDHSKTLEHYHENKMRMFKYQSENDYALYSADNKYTISNIKILEEHQSFKANKIGIRFDNDIKSNEIGIIGQNIIYNGNVIYKDDYRKLVGDHNLKNIMFVLGIAVILGLDLEKASNSIKNFEPLKYRMEDLGFHENNIHFYLDTIATIPEATIGVISSTKNIDTLLVGGENRHTSYNELIDFLAKSDISNIICMYDTGKIIYNGLKSITTKNLWFTRDMREAYKIALNVTTPGKVCLLSPASSSKDVFKDFEEKGELFRALVNGVETDIKEHKKDESNA